MTLIGVYGASGFGREVMPLVREQMRAAGQPCEVVFVDDGADGSGSNGHRVLTYPQFLAEPAADKRLCFAIANSQVREKLATRAVGDGIACMEVRGANAVVLDAVEIGTGAVLCPFVTLTSNIRIGKHFHANIYAYVAHDCVIGDYVTFAPGVKCNGNVVIEDHAYVGTGAVLKQGKPGAPLVIGKGAVVGMGAVVTRDVPAGATVVGNPARPLVK
ncbi:acetyltransferase [Ralstonia pseudosolanacearum]|uniref:Acetyltransferase n=1 Tax=Ralstonia solanacearum TaxID=305 RepID=A0A0S4TWE5_RALSL|nr:acetyltransferase [Ralstonia pseudosolanacearum]OAI76851.1 acetyltransferase [Ralstonia solanacearum]QCX52062.1 acetyltransferase [Ralstonia pseudosolanacearum]CUV14354.1 putative acetyl transferase protein [Ralstonia solanacearum]